MIDAYLRNRIVIGPVIDDKSISSKQVYIRKLSLIDHVRVQGYKCIAYVNLDLYSIGIRRDKLMLKGREAVLMGFDSKTTKQYCIYASDLGRCIKLSIIIFFKDIQGGQVDLKLKKFISNDLIVRNSIKCQVSRQVSEQITSRPTIETPSISTSSLIKISSICISNPSKIPFKVSFEHYTLSPSPQQIEIILSRSYNSSVQVFKSSAYLPRPILQLISIFISVHLNVKATSIL